MRERRSTILLIGLLLVAGYYGWTQLGDGRSGTGWGGGRRASSTTYATPPRVVRLDVGQLDREPGVYQQGRNLFRFGQPPKPAAPPPPPKPKPPPKPQQKLSQSKPAKPQPPPVDVTYLGSFGRADRRIAVFSDDDAIYNAVVGDIIKEKFVVVTIGYESADLGFVGFPDASPTRLAAGG